MKAELHIQTALRNGKTFLKKAYHTTPLKIADIREDRSQKLLRLMLMSSSPGILDRDEYRIKIEVNEACSLELQTQSYQRIFSMKNGASQVTEVHLAKGASYSYLPHPSVPHVSSVFIAKNKIFLSSGCNLLWGEVLTCGRKLTGEQFLFSIYHNVTEVFLHNKLVIKENLLLQPSATDVSLIGQLEGYTHQASLLYLNETVSVNALVAELHRLLLTQKNICFGVSALPVAGLVVRMLGYQAEQLHNLHKIIADYITTFMLTTGNTAIKAGAHAN